MRPRRSPPLQPFVSVFPEISAVPLYLRSIKRTEIRLSGSDRIGSGHYSFAGILQCVFSARDDSGKWNFPCKLGGFRQLGVSDFVSPFPVCTPEMALESCTAHDTDGDRRGGAWDVSSNGTETLCNIPSQSSNTSACNMNLLYHHINYVTSTATNILQLTHYFFILLLFSLQRLILYIMFIMLKIFYVRCSAKHFRTL